MHSHFLRAVFIQSGLRKVLREKRTKVDPAGVERRGASEARGAEINTSRLQSLFLTRIESSISKESF
jgi:hypothetical protein